MAYDSIAIVIASDYLANIEPHTITFAIVHLLLDAVIIDLV
jgi:hypothetical protein